MRHQHVGCDSRENHGLLGVAEFLACGFQRVDRRRRAESPHQPERGRGCLLLGALIERHQPIHVLLAVYAHYPRKSLSNSSGLATSKEASAIMSVHRGQACLRFLHVYVV